MLEDFIATNSDEILARARSRVLQRNAPASTAAELTEGLPAFLDQLREALRRASVREQVDHIEIEKSAGLRGGHLFSRGLTVAQVVHDYGNLCQVITLLAVEQNASIPADEFQTLNFCLDEAIAGAVTSYGIRRERAISEEGTERLGVLAHEMRNALGSALLSFAIIKSGVVAPGGRTSVIHERSLMTLQMLIDRSLAEVRLDTGIENLEPVAVHEIIEEVEVSASIVAQTRGLQFVVVSVGPTVIVEADRQILAAAIANLLQNGLKFTRPKSTVTLRASITATRVLIEVEDECGGLPAGNADLLLRPFAQQGRDRTGVGLGLSICVKAVKAIGGELRIRDLPGKGCVFTIDLPRQLPPPPVRTRQAEPTNGESRPTGQA
jgi:signal transduction histidine kinase